MKKKKIVDIEQIAEQIRLTYAHVLKTNLELFESYKKFKEKMKNEDHKRYFQLADKYFCDKSGKLKWEHISNLIPPNLEQNIKEKYPTLRENEIRLCCLLLFDVSCFDISEILPYTQQSVYSVTHKIKKKAGMEDIIPSLRKMLLRVTC